MRISRRICSILLIACTGLGPPENTYGQKPSIPPDPGIPIGERLEYKITWLRIPVGIGELWAKEKTTLGGREVIHVVGSIKTNKVLSKIFPMYNEAQSWIDPKTFESVQFEKKVDELFIKQHERTVFDPARKKGYFESFKTGSKMEFDITTPVHDVFSVFYWARRQKFLPDQPVKTVFTCDQKNWALQIETLGLETVKLRRKKMDTFHVEPTTRVGGVEKRGKAWFNIATDASRKPVRIVYKAPFGSVVGTLQEPSP